MICNYCGKEAKASMNLVFFGNDFCSPNCIEKYCVENNLNLLADAKFRAKLNIEKEKICNQEKQKFEEIKKMAWGLFKEHQYVEIVCDNSTIEEVLPIAWKSAEEFYNYAKEKEQEGVKNIPKIVQLQPVLCFHIELNT